MKTLYVLQRLDNGLVKVGATYRLRKRLCEHRKDCRCGLSLLASHEVSVGIEPKVHRRLRELGAGLPDEREWFRPTPEVMGFVLGPGLADFIDSASVGHVPYYSRSMSAAQHHDKFEQRRQEVIVCEAIATPKRVALQQVRAKVDSEIRALRSMGRIDGRTLSKAIKARGLSQSWLAEQLGVSRQRASQLVRGTRGSREVADRVQAVLRNYRLSEATNRFIL